MVRMLTLTIAAVASALGLPSAVPARPNYLMFESDPASTHLLLVLDLHPSHSNHHDGLTAHINHHLVDSSDHAYCME